MEVAEQVEIVPPLIAVDGLDIGIFDSVRSAEVSYCATEDAQENTFFDSTGRVLSVAPIDDVSFRLVPTDVVQVDGLRESLRDHLRAVGEPIGDAAPLAWLVERKIERGKYRAPLFNFWPFRRSH